MGKDLASANADLAKHRLRLPRQTTPVSRMCGDFALERGIDHAVGMRSDCGSECRQCIAIGKRINPCESFATFV